MDNYGIEFRHITINDYKYVVKLLGQLTTVGEISQVKFTDFVSKLNSNHFVVCCEYYDIEADDKIIVAIGTVFIEKKLTHGCGKVAHIEDVVVDTSFRNFHIGTQLIKHLVTMSKDKDVYKVILNCSEQNKTFYEKCGFQKDQHQMKIVF